MKKLSNGSITVKRDQIICGAKFFNEILKNYMGVYLTDRFCCVGKSLFYS